MSSMIDPLERRKNNNNQCYCLRCVYLKHITLISIIYLVSSMLKYKLFFESILLSVYYLNNNKENLHFLKYCFLDIFILLCGASSSLLSSALFLLCDVYKLKTILYPLEENEEFVAYGVYKFSNNLSECGYWDTSIFINKLILMSGYAGYVKTHI